MQESYDSASPVAVRDHQAVSRCDPRSDLPSIVGDDPSAAYQIAIVGCGPKGFYGLESLLRKLRLNPVTRRVKITVFAPSKNRGAGNVYAVDQPLHLKMNFAARHINAWRRDQHQDRPAMSLLQWLESENLSDYGSESFVPRSVVGRYLESCFKLCTAQLPPHVQLEYLKAKVATISRVDGDRWKVETELADDKQPHIYDDVLLATGHGGWQRDGIFPVDRRLSESAVPAACHVAVRGFSLTFIDAAISLTQGRGGKFCSAGNDGELLYRPCGREPKMIFPFSRSGRPMLSKPDYNAIALPDELASVWQSGRAGIRSLIRPAGGFDFQTALWPKVVQTAAFALAYVSHRPVTANLIQETRAWFTNWYRQPVDGDSVKDVMRNSIKVACGEIPLDHGWALGESWRQLYPALVDQISYGGLSDRSWRRADCPRDHGDLSLPAIAAEMEKIAFGPPPENLAKILALHRAGILDFSLLRWKGSSKAAQIASGQVSVKIHAVVNATMPSVSDCQSPIISGLLHSGTLVKDVSGGVRVDRSARAIAADGHVVPGLAIAGRATEGWVLGNDTLSRNLHCHLERWADAVSAKVAIGS